MKREHYRGTLTQTPVYLGKLLRMFFYQSDWKVLPMAAIIAGLVTFVTGQNMFFTQEGTLTGCFALVCVCIWNGFFNSIQVVCRERAIVKREHRAGMKIRAYIGAHMIYQCILCLLQTAITLGVCHVAEVRLPASGLITPWGIVDLFISLFLITYASDIMSLAVSCIVNNTTTAMTVMPFLLIIQLVFSGGFFELGGAAKKLTVLTVSRWGLQSLGTIGNYNSLPMVTLWNTIFKFKDMEIEGQKPVYMVIRYIEQNGLVDAVIQESGAYNQNPMFEYTVGNLLTCWLMLVLFIIVFGVVSCIALRFVDRDSR
ncbi:MAG: ABC transporter permease [Lachnospiraceae bacterium]|nr:ABC transporter permease [Lachnospiraceae bacterium]